MTAWCFNHNFVSPPANFPAPKPLTSCKIPLDKWCTSRSTAIDCGVRKSHLESNKLFYTIFNFRLKNGVKLLVGSVHHGNFCGHGRIVSGPQLNGALP